MKKLLAIVLALAMLFSFVGCGGGKDKTNSSTPATENKEKVVVGYTSCEPMIYEGYKDGQKQLVGFDCELAKKVFEGLNMEPTFKAIAVADVYTELENGSIDCYWGGFVSNISDADGVKRSDKVDFSHNYMKTWQVLIAKINNGMEKVEGLKGKKGVVQLGTSGELFAKNYQTVALDIESVASYADCIEAINVGNANYAIVDIQAAGVYCGGGDTIEIMPSLKGETEYFAVAFKKGSDLKDKVNTQLEKLSTDGILSNIAKSYNLSDYLITDFTQ